MTDRPAPCAWVASDQPRVVKGRHEEDFSMSETAPKPDAVTKVARDLREIESMHAALSDQAVHKANDHELPGGAATVNLAGVANIEAWQNQVDTALRLAYENGDEPPEIDDDDEWEPVLQTLAFWSEDWRRVHDAEYGQRPTVASEVNFIRYQLGWAWENEPKFEDFARDIRKARVRLENVLYAGRRVERTRVPCNNPECETKPNLIVTRGEDIDGAQDRHKCPACKRRYDEHDFRKAYAEQLRSEGAAKFVSLVDAIGTLKALGRPEPTIRKWLSPPVIEHVKDLCTECGKKWPPSEYPACPRVTNGGEECGGELAPVKKGNPDAVVEGYCEVGSRKAWVWWPDLWTLHLTTKTRNRDAA